MRRADLIADCGNCAAVCCVVTCFEASDDFAFDKPAGTACQHLRADCRCGIHDQLVERGCPGCAIYDCYGAGPRVTRTFAGLHDAEQLRTAAFLVLRVLHELLWLLTEAATLCPASHHDLNAQLSRAIETLDAMAAGPPAALRDLDLRAHQLATHALLRGVGTALGGRGRRRLVLSA
jgi:hypothetical protein